MIHTEAVPSNVTINSIRGVIGTAIVDGDSRGRRLVSESAAQCRICVDCAVETSHIVGGLSRRRHWAVVHYHYVFEKKYYFS